MISLDEFKGNSGGQKYNSIVADPQNKEVLDILPNRYENDLIKYFFPSFDAMHQVDVPAPELTKSVS